MIASRIFYFQGHKVPEAMVDYLKFQGENTKLSEWHFCEIEALPWGPTGPCHYPNQPKSLCLIINRLLNEKKKLPIILPYCP